MTRATLPVLMFLAAGLSATASQAKPLHIRVDAALDDCRWAAEASVVDVGETIQVRVTEDADAVYRGLQHLGQVVEINPARGGPTTCRNQVAALAGTPAKVLMIVNKDGCLYLLGTPTKVDGKAGYHLGSWCDWNAVVFSSQDKELGRHVGEAFDGNFAVTKAAIGKRFQRERRQVSLALAEVLSTPKVDLPLAEIRAAIVRLGHDDFHVRERAQRELTALDADAAEFLQQQGNESTDPEVRARLLAAARQLQSPLQRHAMAIRARGVEAEANVLREAMQVGAAGELHTAIKRRLGELQLPAEQ